MSIPSFNVGSKPTISAEAFQQEAEKASSKFLNDPGTYDLLIKSVTWKNPSEKDPVWVTLEIGLEDTEGRTIRHFLMVPTECRNDFLFGDKKQAFAFENLSKFMRGLGIAIDFTNAMEQVAQIFGDAEQLIGKNLRVRLAYDGDHSVYLGKTDDGLKRYQIVKKDGTPKDDTIFADSKALAAYAAEHKIKLEFIKVKEIFPAKEPALVLGAAVADDIIYPF